MIRLVPADGTPPVEVSHELATRFQLCNVEEFDEDGADFEVPKLKFMDAKPTHEILVLMVQYMKGELNLAVLPKDHVLLRDMMYTALFLQLHTLYREMIQFIQETIIKDKTGDELMDYFGQSRLTHDRQQEILMANKWLFD